MTQISFDQSPQQLLVILVNTQTILSNQYVSVCVMFDYYHDYDT